MSAEEKLLTAGVSGVLDFARNGAKADPQTLTIAAQSAAEGTRRLVDAAQFELAQAAPKLRAGAERLAALPPEQQIASMARGAQNVASAAGNTATELAKQAPEIAEQVAANPTVKFGTQIIGDIARDYGLNFFGDSFKAFTKGDILGAAKGLGLGALNFGAELLGLKDLFVRLPEAMSRGDVFGAVLALVGGLGSLCSLGLGAPIKSLFFRGAQAALKVGAKEATERFAAATAREIGEEIASAASEKLAGRTLNEVVSQTFEATGKEVAEALANKVEKGASLTGDLLKKLEEEAQELAHSKVKDATKKLLESSGIDKLITDRVEATLRKIAENAAKGGEALSAELKGLGVPEDRIKDMVKGLQAQFSKPGQAGKFGERFDEELIQIYTDAISKEVGEKLLQAGAKSSFDNGFAPTLKAALNRRSVSVDANALARLNSAAGRGFDSGFREGVRETVERAVREAFDRFRKDRSDDSSQGVGRAVRNRNRDGTSSLSPNTSLAVDSSGGTYSAELATNADIFIADKGDLWKALKELRENQSLAANSIAKFQRPIDTAATSPATTTQASATPTVAAHGSSSDQS